ncbi:phage tail assembly chaperone [Bacillus swezeyi]|uniref:phage tail assembly chaperone n=1 Tax=Bacillus swezeyi TaxID=1925020 RepID=UPI003F88EC39
MSEKQEQKVYDLSFFMPGQTVVAEEIKVPISKRFVDKKGNVIPFVFKPITTERIDELEKENTTYKNIKGRGRVKDLDTQRFYARIAIESTIYPDFRSKELREAYQTADPVEVAKRVLSVGGEYANWLNKAIEINGFEDDLEDLEEEAKN